jgi:hypothetical protein
MVKTKYGLRKKIGLVIAALMLAWSVFISGSQAAEPTPAPKAVPSQVADCPGCPPPPCGC